MPVYFHDCSFYNFIILWQTRQLYVMFFIIIDKIVTFNVKSKPIDKHKKYP